MFGGKKMRAGALALAAALVAVGALATAGGGAAASRGCNAFKAQGDAQEAFVEAGGTPRRNVARMDGDHDGVACEGLSGPYRGYATIGYNKRKGFFFGVATMPSPPSGDEFPCLLGNRHFPDASRWVNVFRVTRRGDKPVTGRPAKAEARPASGRLLWKAERAKPPRGRYYASFEQSIPTTPYGRPQCPEFESQPTLLPRPRKR